MRKWTVEVNLDGGLIEDKITFVINAPMSSIALNIAHKNMQAMDYSPEQYQAHIV